MAFPTDYEFHGGKYLQVKFWIRAFLVCLSAAKVGSGLFVVSTQSDSPGKANFCRHPIWNTQWAPIIKHNWNNGAEILVLGLLHDTHFFFFTSLSPL